MARKRMIDPDFWLDEEIGALSPQARLLYIGLWGICDDNYATFPDRPDWIKLQVLPYDTVDTHALLCELEKIGKIIKFSYEKKDYWYIKNFFKHQVINRPSKPKYPKFKATLIEDSRSTHLELSNELSKRRGKGGFFKIEKPDSLK